MSIGAEHRPYTIRRLAGFGLSDRASLSTLSIQYSCWAASYSTRVMWPINYSGAVMRTDSTPAPDFASAVTGGSGGALVEVWAVPGASRTEITGLHGDAVRIRVSAPPEGGKANRALENVLAAIAGVEVSLIRGQRSRRKRFLVKDVSPADLVRLLTEQTG
jgi:hypothetical protein